jgi:hypothetical protein
MYPIQPGSIEDLNEFLMQFTEEADEDGGKATRRHNEEFFHDIRLHFRDLNREIAHPGTSSDIPDGAVGLRGDWDFWIVAYLPYRFVHLSCMEIASCIWPDVKDVVALPDSGEYWWTAKSDDSLEVPGEPFEVWATMRYEDDRDPEIIRIETFSTADRAAAYIRSRPRQDAISHEVLAWTNGQRRPKSVESA